MGRYGWIDDDDNGCGAGGDGCSLYSLLMVETEICFDPPLNLMDLQLHPLILTKTVADVMMTRTLIVNPKGVMPLDVNSVK
jgi:hypothetical protein